MSRLTVEKPLRKTDIPPPPRAVRWRGGRGRPIYSMGWLPALLLALWIALTVPLALTLMTRSRAGLADSEHFWTGLVAVILTGLIVLLSVLGWLKTRRQLRMLRLGAVVQGVVSARSSAGGGPKAAPYWEIEYGYTVAGRTHYGRHRVEPSTYQIVEPGEPVTVFYDPHRPQHSVAYEFGPLVLVPAPAPAN